MRFPPLVLAGTALCLLLLDAAALYAEELPPCPAGTVVYFAAGSAELQAPARSNVETLVRGISVLCPEEALLLVIGHADRAEPMGDAGLSLDRALAVYRALLETGVSQQRVYLAAFGTEQPVWQSEEEPPGALNQRVEISLLPPG